METVRLYYENAFTQDFTAVVESCGAFFFWVFRAPARGTFAAMGKSRSRSEPRNSSRRPFSKIPVAFSRVL